MPPAENRDMYASGRATRPDCPQESLDENAENQRFTESRSMMHNEKVSDQNQPPMTLNLSLSESAGSRSLRCLRCSF